MNKAGIILWFFGGALFIIGMLMIVMMIFSPPGLPPQESHPEKSVDKLDEIITRGRLIVATDPASAPMSEHLENASRDNSTRCAPAEFTKGEFSGFDVAIAEEIASRLDVEACFVTPAWTQITSGSWADQWDISVGSMAITAERMRSLYFTQPYNSGPTVFFVSRNNTQYHEPSDLSGKHIGVCAGCAQEQYLKEALSLPGQNISFLVKNATIVAYNYETVALSDLAAGDGTILDAVLMDLPIGQQAIKNGTPIRPLNPPAFSSYLAAAVDRKSARDPGSLVLRVSEIIRDMHHDGTIRALSAKYLSGDYTEAAETFNLSLLHQFDASSAS